MLNGSMSKDPGHSTAYSMFVVPEHWGWGSGRVRGGGTFQMYLACGFGRFRVIFLFD